MVRTLTTVAALAGLAIAVFAFTDAKRARELPVPEPPVAEAVAGVLVVDLVDGSTEADLAAIEAKLGQDLDWVHPLAIDEALAAGEVTDLQAAVAALVGDPRVEVVEPALVMEALGFPNDPMYDKQWNLREMGAPAAWQSTPRGAGITVAVIDTGVTVVEDLGGTRVLKGASFVPGTTPADDNGHGTHVAGTIAQTTNNGKGVAGVAPEATILPVKVLSGGGFGLSPWIAAGIDYAADEGADVINLSLGGSYSRVIHTAIKKARKRGVLVIAAAGNSGRQGVGYPGALEETIGVSALGPGGELAPYSSWGKGVDIAAPGGDKTKAGGGVLQNTVTRGGKGEVYAEYQGTSMATPHVAGAAAALLSTGADPDSVERILLDSARGGDKWDPKLGWGRLDLGAASERLQTGHGGMRFLIGLVAALLVGRLASSGPRYIAVSAVTAALAAGGLFFLHWLPIPGGWIVDLLSEGLLSWPAVLLGPTWMQFPLWLSALVPGAVAFTLGAYRPTRPLAAGLAIGVGAHLLHGAATGTLAPLFLPWGLGTVWLVANATACVLLALALSGAEKLEGEPS